MMSSYRRFKTAEYGRNGGWDIAGDVIVDLKKVHYVASYDETAGVVRLDGGNEKTAFSVAVFATMAQMLAELNMSSELEFIE